MSAAALSQRTPPDLSKLGVQKRSIRLERKGIDEAARTVTLAFASESPVERFFGQEILDCSAKSVRLDRLRDGAPLLLDHENSVRSQIGVIQSASVDGDRICRAVVRFAKAEDDPEADKIFRKVKDGIISRVSVGYAIHAWNATVSDDEEDDVWRAIDWEPFEVSFVAIPADNSVGVGRSAPIAADGPAALPVDTPSRVMADPIAPAVVPAPAAQSAPAPVVINESAERARVQTDELQRMRDIDAIAKQWNCREAAEKAIKDGVPADTFARQILMASGAKPLALNTAQPDAGIGMSDKEVKRFSILSAIRSLMNKRPLDGLEREATEAASKRYGRAPSASEAFILPAEIVRASAVSALRAHTAGTFTDGGALVREEYGDLIEFLRNTTVLGQAGITMLGDIRGNLVFPVQTGGTAVYWVSETGAPSGSSATFAQRTMTPKAVSGFTDYSTQFFAQSSISVDDFVRNELQTVLALAKDLAGLEGTGGAQPLGVKNDPDVQATVTFGGAATWAKVVKFETDVNVANAALASIKYILSSATVGRWKTILKDSVAGAGYLLSEQMTANGYPVLRTNQTTGNIAYFGAWSQLLMASWAGQEVIVDPYTLATSGQVRVTMREMCDFLVRQPKAFNISTDSAAQ